MVCQYLCTRCPDTILAPNMEEVEERNPEAIEELRLFPLNVVLFPGMPLPLRIFEERYKLMIGECIEADAPFGVVLIKEGMEVGGPAQPHQIGTAARITQVDRQEDGRMNLATSGDKRFTIVETVHELPYLKGKVRYLPEEIGELQEGELEGVVGLFEELIRGQAAVRGDWMRQANVPREVGLLSYAVAQYLELPAKAKQRLLELPSTGERLHYEIPLLEGAIQRINEELAKRNPYTGPRLN